tara:strand:- start:3170 stop:3784 length:615 start_codon:yes stop_codon:yes gene_type:complete
MTKVFSIGLHKTGTSTLAEALRILGYNVCPESLAYLTREAAADGRYRDCIMLAKEYEAFADTPWNYCDVYKVLDAVFPDAKFILTTRLSTHWYQSLLRWMALGKATPTDVSLKATLGVAPSLDNKGKAIEAYLKHADGVRDYFRPCPDKLLVVDWEQGDGWQELCDFLDKPVPKQPFPHCLSYDPDTIDYVDATGNHYVRGQGT